MCWMQHKMGNQETLDNGLNPPLNHHHYYVMVAIAGPKMLTINSGRISQNNESNMGLYWAETNSQETPQSHEAL